MSRRSNLSSQPSTLGGSFQKRATLTNILSGGARWAVANATAVPETENA
jgi:hypothetical protein